MEWIKRVKQYLKIVYDNKYVKILMIILVCFGLLLIGGIINAIVSSKTNLTGFQKLLTFLIGIGGFMSMALIFMDRIFRIEVQALQLKLTERQIESNSIDEKYISERIVRKIVGMVGSELNPHDSIYEGRAKHYQQEKVVIAENFVDLLGERVKFLKNSLGIDNIQIIFDSGTTIAPILNRLGYKASSDKTHWAKKVDIITNNIKGVQYLLKYREESSSSSSLDHDDRYKEIPIQCTVLPGEILSAYEAIAGFSTIEAIERLGERKDYYTISVTTGNYVLYDLKKKIFMPIARASTHPNIKAHLYNISDEIYVIAPLGKILKGELDETMEQLIKKFNIDLGYKDVTLNESKKSYQLVSKELMLKNLTKTINTNNDIGSWNRKSIIITTERKSRKHKFFAHFHEFDHHITKFETNVDRNNLNGPYFWACKFTKVPLAVEDQVEFEIPHSNLRELVEKYFWVT